MIVSININYSLTDFKRDLNDNVRAVMLLYFVLLDGICININIDYNCRINYFSDKEKKSNGNYKSQLNALIHSIKVVKKLQRLMVFFSLSGVVVRVVVVERLLSLSFAFTSAFMIRKYRLGLSILPLVHTSISCLRAILLWCQ